MTAEQVDTGDVVVTFEDAAMLRLLVKQFDEAGDDPDPVRGLGAQRDAARPLRRVPVPAL